MSLSVGNRKCIIFSMLSRFALKIYLLNAIIIFLNLQEELAHCWRNLSMAFLTQGVMASVTARHNPPREKNGGCTVYHNACRTWIIKLK